MLCESVPRTGSRTDRVLWRIGSGGRFPSGQDQRAVQTLPLDDSGTFVRAGDLRERREGGYDRSCCSGSNGLLKVE